MNSPVDIADHINGNHSHSHRDKTESTMKAAPHLPANHPTAPRPAPPRPLESGELFAGRDEVLIVHGSETYRLRRTRQGKLILTK